MKHRKIVAFMTASVGCFIPMSIAAGAQKYNVNLPAPADSEGAMAYMLNYDTGEKMDSVSITGSTINFAGEVDEPVWVRITVDGDRAGMFILEPGNLTVGQNGVVNGGNLNTVYADFNKFYQGLANKMRALPNVPSSQAAAEAIQQEFEVEKNRVAAANKGNAIGYYLFLQDAYSLSPAELDQALAANPDMVRYERVRKLQEAAKHKLATMPGQMFTDFAVTYDGETKKLSDYVGKGKYTLVDFWASWCGPCIRETAVIKELYDKYASKGLDVLGVAVWDEPQNTLQAIERHKLPWPNILNAQTIPTDLYGISGIPCIILFDPEGRIVSRDLQDDDLRQAVDKAMASVAQ